MQHYLGEILAVREIRGDKARDEEARNEERDRDRGEPIRRLRLKVRVQKPVFAALEPRPGKRGAGTSRAPRVVEVERLGRASLHAKGALIVLDADEARRKKARGIALASPYLRTRVHPHLGGRIGELDTLTPGAGRAVLGFELALLAGKSGLDLGGALDDLSSPYFDAGLAATRFVTRRRTRARAVLAGRDRKEGRRLEREVALFPDAPVLVSRVAVEGLRRTARSSAKKIPAYTPRIALAPFGRGDDAGLDLVLPTVSEGMTRWSYVADPPCRGPVDTGEAERFVGLAAGYIAAVDGAHGAATVLVLPEERGPRRREISGVTVHARGTRVDLIPAFAPARAKRGTPVRRAWALVAGEDAILDERGFVIAARDEGGRRVAIVARRVGTAHRTLRVQVEVGETVKSVRLARREVEGLGALFVGHLAVGAGEPLRLAGRAGAPTSASSSAGP